MKKEFTRLRKYRMTNTRNGVTRRKTKVQLLANKMRLAQRDVHLKQAELCVNEGDMQGYIDALSHAIQYGRITKKHILDMTWQIRNEAERKDKIDLEIFAEKMRQERLANAIADRELGIVRPTLREFILAHPLQTQYAANDIPA